MDPAGRAGGPTTCVARRGPVQSSCPASGVPAAARRKGKASARRDGEQQGYIAGQDRDFVVECVLDPVDSHNGQSVAALDYSKRADGPAIGGYFSAGWRQVSVGRSDQSAPPRCSAVLHPRHDFLSNITALFESNAAILVEQNIMGKGVASLIVRTAFGHAPGDAQRVPLCHGGGGVDMACIDAPDSDIAETQIAQTG